MLVVLPITKAEVAPSPLKAPPNGAVPVLTLIVPEYVYVAGSVKVPPALIFIMPVFVEVLAGVNIAVT